MVNLLQNTIRMLVPLVLACEWELTEAKLPGASDLYCTVALSTSCTCSQEMERIARFFDATDAI